MEKEPIEGEQFEPPVFNTHSNGLKAHFESYGGEERFENGEEELDPIREDIARHFNIPANETHMFVIDNDHVENQRHRRAFSVVIRKKPGEENGWYIDGRTPHVTMLNRLFNYYHVPDDDWNERHLGFLDADGFDDVDKIQKEAEERGAPIYWFIRDTVASPASPPPTETKSDKNLP